MIRERFFPAGVKLLASMMLGLTLSGCLAAAAYGPMLVGGAAIGFSIFKTVQLSTGGEAVIELDEQDPEPGDLKTIRAANSIAVWPVNGGEGEISDRLSRLTSLEVISPSNVRKWIDDNGHDRDASILTYAEKEQLSSQMGRNLGADLVLVVETGQMKQAEANVWSFDRGEIEFDFEMALVSSLKERIVWKEPGRLLIEVGGTIPGEGEINKIAQDAIAERVAQLVN
ncbi:MAG: hypothetical protein AAF530_07320 [Pseudomonadota bacterium]